MIETVASYARNVRIEGVEAWTRELAARRPPSKADQEQLDANYMASTLVTATDRRHLVEAPQAAQQPLLTHPETDIVARCQ